MNRAVQLQNHNFGPSHPDHPWISVTAPSLEFGTVKLNLFCALNYIISHISKSSIICYYCHFINHLSLQLKCIVNFFVLLILIFYILLYFGLFNRIVCLLFSYKYLLLHIYLIFLLTAQVFVPHCVFCFL